jgi:hypothetical protein
LARFRFRKHARHGFISRLCFFESPTLTAMWDKCDDCNRTAADAAQWVKRLSSSGRDSQASKGVAMARCEHCGNEYDKSFTVTMDEQSHTFDSFECAIATLAPRCAHCDCAVIGHGVEAEGAIYCCAHCAKKSGVSGLRDRADAAPAAA